MEIIEGVLATLALCAVIWLGLVVLQTREDKRELSRWTSSQEDDQKGAYSRARRG